MNLLRNKRIFHFLSRQVVCAVHTDEPVCALTFDDGPSRRHTPELLDTLAQLDCRATFFVLGGRARRFPSIVSRAAEAGHEIGNHTDSHARLTLLPNAFIRRELERGHRTIIEITGQPPVVFRPPGGWINRRVLEVAQSFGYESVIGDVYPRDSHLPGTRRIVREILGHTQPGSIIILHDSSSWGELDRRQTLDAVREFVPRLRDRGFSFVTASELVACGDVVRPETVDREGGWQWRPAAAATAPAVASRAAR